MPMLVAASVLWLPSVAAQLASVAAAMSALKIFSDFINFPLVLVNQPSGTWLTDGTA